HTALAISAALVERSATGKGRRVDVSLRDGLLAVQGGWNALFFATGEQPARRGTASAYTAPNETFTTADGHLNVAIVSDRHFMVLCDALDRPDLATDRRYATNDDRMTHRVELAAELNAAFATDTTGTWLAILTRAGLPVGRIRSLGEVFDDPQAVLNEMSVEIEHPTAGRVTVTGSPMRYDGTPAVADDVPPPRLGADGPALLAELGADPAEIKSLVERGSLRLP
ncbi:MAG: CoA transferase, partial [Acidimicrobiia bacterium]|nr:CoA transferase [Acidimicrobiia bacterium]